MGIIEILGQIYLSLILDLLQTRQFWDMHLRQKVGMLCEASWPSTAQLKKIWDVFTFIHMTTSGSNRIWTSCWPQSHLVFWFHSYFIGSNLFLCSHQCSRRNENIIRQAVLRVMYPPDLCMDNSQPSGKGRAMRVIFWALAYTQVCISQEGPVYATETNTPQIPVT